jgi:PKD repeat protein
MNCLTRILVRPLCLMILAIVVPNNSWGQTANAGADQTICANGQTTLSGSANGGNAPYIYSWTPATGLSNPNIANPICTVDISTTYTLTVTDASNNTDTDQVTVTVLPAPTPVLNVADPVQSSTFNNLTTFFICGENNFTFDFTDASNAPATSTFSVNWGNGSNSTPVTTGWTSSQSFSLGISQGTYTITAPNACISTLNFNLFVGIAPDGGAVADGNTNVCLGQPINASWTNIGNNPPGTNYILNWGDGSSDTFVHPPPAIVPHTYTTSSCAQPGGQFCVSYEIINPCTPARTGEFCQVLVSEVPQASFTMTADTLCINTTVTITDASTGAQAPDCDTPNHIWSISPGTYAITSGSLGLTNSSNNPNNWTSGSPVLGVQFTAPGTYSITDVVGNNICGRDTLVRTLCVEGPPVPNFTLNPLVGCSPLVVNSVNNSILNSCDLTRTWEAAQLTQGCAPQPGSVAFNAQANAPQFTFTGQGTYEVTLTLENSCGSFEQTIAPITVNGPPILDQATLPIICAGQGCVTPSAVSQNCGSPMTAYGWTFPGGTPANSNQQSPGQVCYSTPGSYAVTASATNACGTATDVVNLVVSTLPIANAGADATICAGSTTTLNGSASGGTAPYAFSWSPATGLNNPSIASPTANPGTTTTYTLTVTDAGGCIGTDQVVVTVNTPATASAGGPYAVCAGSSVAITATASGAGSWTAPPGTGTFLNATNAGTTFTPAPGQTGNSITLTWTTTDPDGPGPCPVVISTASVTVNPPATATIIGTYTACSNAPVNIVATTNNNGTWSTNGSGTFANASSATTTYTPGASEPNNPVTITWTTIDPDGAGPCTAATVSSTIAVNPAATANAGGPYTTCGTGAVSITSSGSGAGVWSSTPGAGTFASTTNATTTFTPASATPGTISLTWTTNDPDGPGPCAAVSNTATLTVNEPATAATTGPYTACSNAPVTIAAITNSNGTWTSNGTGTFGSNTSSNTTYTPGSGEPNNPVTVTWTTIDPDGPGPCTPATASTAIIINPAATANAGGPYTTCGNGAVSITSTGSGAGVWSTTPGAGTFASTTNTTTTFTPASDTPGTISLTWTTNDPDASGPCAAVSNTATLTVNEPATATIDGPFIACSNAPVNIAATTNSDGTWTTNGAGTFANSTSASTTYTPGVGEPNNPVTITWTTIDPDGTGPCTPATASNLITVNTAPTVDAGSDLTLCLNSGAITLDGTPDNGDWSGTGVSPSGAFNPVTVGVFDLTYTFTDANNCTNSDAMTVTVNDAATANANGPYSTCGTTTIALNATTNGTGQWTGGAGTFAIASSSATTYTPDPTEVNTTIPLTWETFDPDGTGPCPGASATALLTMNPPATVAPGGPYTICSSDEANVQVTTTPGGGTWTGGAGTIGSPNNSTTDYTPDPSEAGATVLLTWTTVDPDGTGPCPAVSADVSVNVLEAAIAAANGPYATCGTEAIALNATTNGTGQWTGGVGSFADASSTTTTYTPDLSEVNSTITLTWETFDPDGAGPCPGADDEAELNITEPATAVAGGPYDVCSNSAVEVLVTTTPGAGLWSGGTGTILDPVNPVTTYTPAPAEAGTAVILTWTTVDPDGSGPCEPEVADVTVNVLEAAVAVANGPYAVCGAEAIGLAATTNGTGEWSGGSGTYADASDPNTTYTPALAEIGTSIQLTWSTFDPDGAGPCEGAEDNAPLTISEPATAIPDGPYDVCSNSSVEVSVSTTPGTGSWTGGSGSFLDTTNPTTTYTPAPAEAGNTVILTWTTIDPDDGGPCPAVSAAVTVNVLAAASAEANGPYVTCGPDPVDINATANGSGSWSGGVGSFGDAQNVITTYTADPGEFGNTITLTWTTNDPDGPGPCPDAADTAELLIHTLPIADAGLDLTLACGDVITGTATAGAGPNYTYSWSPTTGLITPNVAVTPVTSSGTYTLLVTDANGCTDTDSVQVTVTGLETMAQAVDVEVCLFDAVDLEGFATDGLAPHTFTWTPTAYLTPPTGIGATVSFSYSLPLTQDSLFTHVLQVVDAFGCADTDTLTVTVHPLPVVVVGADTSLCAYDPPFDLTADPLGGTWNPSNTVDPALLTFGNNPFVYSYTDANNCTNTDELVVSVNEVPQADFSAPDTACVNTNVFFTNQSSCPTCTNIAYTWDFGDGSPTSNLVSPQYSYADTGLFVVTLISSSGFGCSDTIALPLRIIKVPEVGFSFMPEVGCGPLEVALTNTSQGLPINFLWTIESFGVSDLADPGPITFPVAPCDSIYYSILLSASNQCGSVTAVDSVKVFSPPQPLLVVSADTVCSPFNLEAYNVTECAWATTYAWNFGDGTGSNTQDLLVNHVYTADSLPETFVLTLSAQNVCGTVNATDTVVVYPNTVTAFFNTAPLTGCPPLPVQFTQSMLGITFWTWNFGDGNTGQDQDPLYVYDEEGTYAVNLIVSNGCAWDTMAQQVTVLSPPLFEFVAEPDTLCVLQPTSFTPSGENISGLAWAFGDGATSTLTAPSHAYAEAGQYDVALTAFSTTTGCPATVIHPVVVLNTPVASVTAIPDQGCAPLSVSFANATTAGDFFTWDFGDGNTSARCIAHQPLRGCGHLFGAGHCHQHHGMCGYR